MKEGAIVKEFPSLVSRVQEPIKLGVVPLPDYRKGGRRSTSIRLQIPAFLRECFRTENIILYRCRESFAMPAVQWPAAWND